MAGMYIYRVIHDIMISVKPKAGEQ